MLPFSFFYKKKDLYFTINTLTVITINCYDISFTFEQSNIFLSGKVQIEESINLLPGLY